MVTLHAADARSDGTHHTKCPVFFLEYYIFLLENLAECVLFERIKWPSRHFFGRQFILRCDAANTTCDEARAFGSCADQEPKYRMSIPLDWVCKTS